MIDPIERDEYGRLLEHEYDGIREYDNPTPGWWHMIFLGSIVFAVVYYFFFTFSPLAWTPQSQLAAARTREFQIMFAEIGELEPDEPTILKLMVDPKWMAVAEGLFATYCTSCHGSNGEGLVGPNMTDNSYKNLKVLADIPVVIYPLLLTVLLTALGLIVGERAPAETHVLRGFGAPFIVLPSGEVSNQLRVTIRNRTDVATAYTVELVGVDGGHIEANKNPFTVGPGELGESSMTIVVPPGIFTQGKRDAQLRITSDGGYETSRAYRLLGPFSTPSAKPNEPTGATQ